MRKSVMLSLGLAAMALVFAGPAMAQQGFYIGTGLGAAFPSMSGDVQDLEPSTGFNFEFVHLGYNFTDQLGVGMQVGGAMGQAKEKFAGEDVDWKQGYIGLSGRFTYPMDPISPYVELGITENQFYLTADEGSFTSEAAIGYRIAIGAIYPMGGFYLAPELAYLSVNYTEGQVKVDDPPPGTPDEMDVEFESNASMILLQLKVGWQPGG